MKYTIILPENTKFFNITYEDGTTELITVGEKRVKVTPYKIIKECPECGKRAVTIGYKSCSICRKKRNDHYRNKYEKIHPVNRDEWSEHGWCYRCGDPVMKGKQLCEKCYEQNVENSRLSASYQTHWWRNANKDIFKKGDASESRIKATS